MCHGFGGTKEENPPGMARLLAGAGYRVLTFDYRGFGGSEGFRARIVPEEQIEDAATALEYFAARPDVDGGRVAFYGSSLGGGMVAGALLKSAGARAAVLVVPVVTGSRRIVRPPMPALGALLARAREALVRKAASGEVEIVDRGEILRDPVTAARYQGKSYPIVLESLVHLASGLTPIDWAPFIKQPVLVIAVAGDAMIPLDLLNEFHDALAGPRALHVFPGGHHYSVYEELLEDTFRLAQGWLERHCG